MGAPDCATSPHWGTPPCVSQQVMVAGLPYALSFSALTWYEAVLELQLALDTGCTTGSGTEVAIETSAEDDVDRALSRARCPRRLGDTGEEHEGSTQ